MSRKKFAQDIEKRPRQFAVGIIKISVRLPNTPEERVVRNQLTKAGTSVGTNYREANRARSKADFRNKIKICESESSETQFWLEVISEVKWLEREEIKADYDECSDLLALFTSIGSK